MALEVLAGDFKGETGAVDVVLTADPDVFAHNLETVPRLSRQVRVQASYPPRVQDPARTQGARRDHQDRAHARPRRGRGRKCEEVLARAARVGVDIVTLGQYLRPSHEAPRNRALRASNEFVELKAVARAKGIPHVDSGPLVRSSYHADGQREIVLALRNRA